ncbi:GNAT family N-acetyltransferase, partial [Paenisporosarcina sp. NPDC076898]
LLKGVQLAIINNTTNRLIGDIYLKSENCTFWIGYTISPFHAKQGYAYEVLVAIISWLKQKGCIRINAGVSPENLASINLLKKLNFTFLSSDEGEHIYILDLEKI